MNILFIIIGVFLMFLGGLVWYFKFLEIIPGFNEEDIINKNDMARWIGINYILMGVSITGISVFRMFIADFSELGAVFIFVLIIYIFVVIIYIGGRRFQ